MGSFSCIGSLEELGRRLDLTGELWIPLLSLGLTLCTLGDVSDEVFFLCTFPLHLVGWNVDIMECLIMQLCPLCLNPQNENLFSWDLNRGNAKMIVCFFVALY